MTGLSLNETMEEVTAASDSQVAYLRQMARTNLYFMSKGVLGYKQVNERVHGAFCRFFESCEKLRRMGLMPRSHLKTSIATIADSIRLGISDPEDTRLLILNEGATGSVKILSEIRGHFERNKMLRHLFPDIVPDRFVGPGVVWSGEFANLKRNSVYKEPTYTAAGVGTALVGGHYTRIKADDLVGFEALQSPAVMQATIAFYKTIEPLLSNQNVDIIDIIGTRWALHDLYSFIMEFYGTRLAVFVREAIENGEIIFPEMHTMEEYATLMKEAPLTWYAQYANNPLAGGATDFPQGAVQEYRFSLDGRRVILYLQSGKTKEFFLAELDRVILCDPNSGERTAPDEAAMVVTGVTPDDEVLTLDDFSGRPTPSEYVDLIFEKAKRWDTRVAGIEQVAAQSTKHYFEKKAEQEGFSVRVEPLKPRNREKLTRIRKAVEPVLKSRRLFCLTTQSKLRGQLDRFPQLSEFGLIDCLGYGPEVWRKGMRQTDLDEQEELVSKIVDKRDPLTGY